jgi:microcystin-dependent protein
LTVYNNFLLPLKKTTLGEIIMAEPFLGEIRTFGFNFAPQGWATCDGQILSIAQNTALFALLGTTYGGDGVTTFALPNLQGNVGIHAGNGFAQGSTGGVQNVTLDTSQLPSHSHPAEASTLGANKPSPTGNSLAVDPTGLSAFYQSASPNTNLNAGTIGATGGGQPHNNMQPYLVLNFCIALEGIFPSRN